MSNQNNVLLVVDDEVEILKAIQRQFRRKYRVLSANNASLALETLAQENVQVIISDQRMPEITGTQLLEKVKNKYPDAVRIILTGYSDIKAVIDSINQGNVYRYLTKPWDTDELEYVVDKAFEQFWLVTNNRQLLQELKETNVLLEKEIHERKTAEQALKKHRDLLEVEVEKRTSQLQQMNKDLIKARDIAERANKSKSMFLANMSHDIRTPMNGIIGMVDILKETQLSQIQHSYLDTIGSSADTLLCLINDILDFSKIEANQLVLESVHFKLNITVRQTIDLLSVKAKEKNLTLFYSIAPGTPDDLKGDPVRIQQILFNLIGNAIKFTDSGEVNVFIFAKEKSHPLELKIFVKDTGIGISQEAISKLFKPFSQADSSITRKHGGTGLGLSISKQLIEKMNGDIEVKSQLGVGSVFIVTLRLEMLSKSEIAKEYEKPAINNLPKCPDRSFTHDTSQSSSRSLNQDESAIQHIKKMNLSVLFAEDTKPNQKIGSIYLSKLNCTTDIVGNGEEAIEKLTKNKYDLVLMDLMMPIMDGLSATKTIRNKNSEVLDHDIPIIAMTASVMKGDREKCLDAGMNDFLPKPVKFKALVDKLYQNFVMTDQNNSAVNKTKASLSPS